MNDKEQFKYFERGNYMKGTLIDCYFIKYVSKLSSYVSKLTRKKLEEDEFVQARLFLVGGRGGGQGGR